MTVGELIEKLKQCDGSSRVFGVEEGYGYFELSFAEQETAEGWQHIPDGELIVVVD